LTLNGSGSSFPRAVANGVSKIIASASFRGKIRLANLVGGVAGRLTPEADCQPVPGACVTVSLNDRIGRMMWAGCYERELLTILRHMLTPGMAFVDVGAQIGYFSMAAAALVGRSGAVYSFEPDSECFSRLSWNSRAYPWVKVYNAAVADFTGQTAFYRTPRRSESGWGSMFDPNESREKISVRVLTLDNQMEALAVASIGFIKIDVEGAECRVLEGARATITRTRPMIWVEANDVCLSRDGRSIPSLLGLLADLNYTANGLYDRRSRSFENVVAIPRERLDLVEKIRRLKINLRVT
jgi:FkbM family methyltransferase